MQISVGIQMTENEKFIVQVNSVNEDIPDYSNTRRFEHKSYAFDTLGQVNDFLSEVFKKD